MDSKLSTKLYFIIQKKVNDSFYIKKQFKSQQNIFFVKNTNLSTLTKHLDCCKIFDNKRPL